MVYDGNTSLVYIRTLSYLISILLTSILVEFLTQHCPPAQHSERHLPASPSAERPMSAAATQKNALRAPGFFGGAGGMGQPFTCAGEANKMDGESASCLFLTVYH